MSKRLQVLLPDEEMKEIRAAARLEDMTVGQWVRKSLREVRQQRPVKSKEFKLAAIRKALTINAPTCDIEQMNAEIERGYLYDLPGLEYPDVSDRNSAPQSDPSADPNRTVDRGR